ncbi:MAG: hypothetical protein RLZZ352_1073 [Pseudomonadota bacterium]|jgi:hypothetical protein
MVFFASTVFLSAFLLFQVQPIVAKMILPWFGGSSSVWNTCMVFFQLELLAGYTYVHALHQYLTPRKQMLLHGSLLVLSLFTLPVVADPAWKAAFESSPSLAVLVVLARTVGAPYLLLSTTGPLMQAWYARSVAAQHTSAQPYRLYALSNLASMLALLSYPVLVEPFLAVVAQGQAWSLGYGVFTVSCLATAAVAWRGASWVAVQGATASADTPSAEPANSAAPRWSTQLLWVGLAACACVLLLCITRYLTHDVAPVPFLWVLPLALYLLSFILCFDAPRYYQRRWFLMALPLAFGTLAWLEVNSASVPLMVTLLCLCLFVFCMVCHGELVRRKPAVQHLTLFYLMLSVGGALGGLLVGLVAPAVFTGYHELPLGLLLCAVLATCVVWADLRPMARPVLATAVLAYAAYLGHGVWQEHDGVRTITRNFYSQLVVADVQDDNLGPVRRLLHGQIIHGEQALDPAHAQEPLAYYCRQGGVGRAIDSLPTGPRHLGVVGLGAGTLAAYGRPGDRVRLYEINDQVLELAQREFSYLGHSPAHISHVLGDGRLMLEHEPAQGFDLLVLDAFSGDSVPAHLLTLEAVGSYTRHLRPEGWLAFNITNHYLDLRPVMASAAERLGRVAVAYRYRAASTDLYCRSSLWVLLLPPATAQALPAGLQGGEVLQPRPGFRPWTDDFSNLLSVLKD